MQWVAMELKKSERYGKAVSVVNKLATIQR